MSEQSNPESRPATRTVSTHPTVQVAEPAPTVTAAGLKVRKPGRVWKTQGPEARRD